MELSALDGMQEIPTMRRAESFFAANLLR